MQVFMDPPDHEGRKDIFDLYLNRTRLLSPIITDNMRTCMIYSIVQCLLSTYSYSMYVLYSVF